MINKIYNKFILDKFHQEYIYNFLLGSLPTLSFFIFFPYYSKIMGRENFGFTLKIIPIFATILAIDLGSNRFVLRAVNLKRSKIIIEKILSNYFNNILFYFITLIIPILFVIKFYFFEGLTNAYLIIFLLSPLLIISNIYYIYFDTNKKYNFNNFIASPISSLTWILLFLISFFKYDTYLTITMAFLLPKILILFLQLFLLPFKININFTKLFIFSKDKRSLTYLISSILTPLCSNIDRLVLIFLNSSGVNWVIVYNGLSEISRKTGGIITPISRIYYRLNHLSLSEKEKLKGLNKKISIVNVLLTIFFSYLFLKNLPINFSVDFFNTETFFPILCSIAFIATSFMQVNSSILFLKSMVQGKIKFIIFYQLIQIIIFSFIYFICYNFFSIIVIPLVYLLMKFIDFHFLKKITIE
jgi:O-antigen/teichoic acid export membrane protein